MELLPWSHMGRNTFFAIMFFFFKYIFYSNLKCKIPEIQLSDERKEKGTLPWYFFKKQQKKTSICNIPFSSVLIYLS